MVGGCEKMFEEKKVVGNKNSLFAKEESTMHYIESAPNSDEYLKIWVKEPTWLQIEKATMSVMNINSRTKDIDVDMQAMYKYMIENFIDKTEPSLSSIDLLRLSPYVGNQIKEVLPNPFDMMQGDEEKNE
tara:strand:- start:5174 stop:5563 length:390 start_codon:yes stop_codon:yes gene_type:complete